MSDDSKRPLGFVNRRGHSAAEIDAADLDGLSIDSQPESVSSEQSQKPKKTKDKSQRMAESKEVVKPKTAGDKPKPDKNKPRVRRHAKWTRKKTFILIGIILVLLAVPILIGEVLRAQYLASTSAAESSLKVIVTNDVLPLQKKSDITAKQVSAVTDKLEEVRDGMCPGGLLDNMATIYPRSQQAHSECIAERGHIASLVTQMRDMVSMLAYIESINAALAPVSAQPTDAFAVIATQQSSWQQVSESLQKLSAPTPLKTANDQLVAAVKSITDGWSKLNVANNAQNAADFQAAEKQLSDGYVAVRASKDAFATAISSKQAIISSLSQNLY